MLRTTGEVLKELINRLKYALVWVKDFPKLVKGTLEIIVDYGRELGRVAREMRSLSEYGIILGKGRIEGTVGEVYFLSYYGRIIRKGTLEEIKRQITFIIRRAGKHLEKYIEEVLRAKIIRYVGQGRRGTDPIPIELAEEIIEYALKYDISRDTIHLSETASTAYIDFGGGEGRLQIGPDVLPGHNPLYANSRLSWKSAIAHELEGHRAAALSGNTHVDDLFEEVQASIRASLFGKELTEIDRQTLWLDAIERLERHAPDIKLDDIIDQLWIEKF